MSANTSPGLTFGIYPFGFAGMPGGVASNVPDDFHRVGLAILDLKGDAKEFLVRTYVHYAGSASAPSVLSQIKQYLEIGVAWDIVLCFRDQGMELEPWLNLVRAIIKECGSKLHTLQITSEPNLTHLPGDGVFPNVRQALVQGVLAARETARQYQANVCLGFNAFPAPIQNDTFWTSLKSLGGPAFVEALDYVGLDLYPDVFGGPVASEGLSRLVPEILGAFRHGSLVAAGIPAQVPIRITENGWPTGSSRSYERQAEVLSTVIRSIYEHRQELNITHYELFGLRDADSSKDDLFYQFGVMRDDYTPKPAYHVYKNLIQQLR